MTFKRMRPVVLAAGLALGLGACGNPYSPGQRAAGGALLGAGGGAAIGALAGGGEGAAVGAIAGGLAGAALGAVTTPRSPRHHRGRAFHRRPLPHHHRSW